MKKKYLLWSMILFVFLIFFIATSLALIPGDFGSAGGGPPDGCVDFEDLMIFALAYGSTEGDGNWNPACDIAGDGGALQPDGVIDFEDLMIFAMYYGEWDDDVFLLAPTFSDSITFDGKTVIDSGEHLITVEFDAPVAPVRVFIVGTNLAGTYEQNLEGIPSYAIEVAMTTIDGKIYTGTGDFDLITDDCSEIWVYVAFGGELCCMNICSYQVVVDSLDPHVDLKAKVGIEENCGTFCEPDMGHRVLITSADWYDPATECYPLCCGDDCTELAGWTMTIYDTQPFGVCCVLDPCIDWIKQCTGTGCPVECDVFGCIPNNDTDGIAPEFDWETVASTNNGTYYVILEASDSVGNTYLDYGILEVGGTWDAPTATINDAKVENCQIVSDGTEDNIMGSCPHCPDV